MNFIINGKELFNNLNIVSHGISNKNIIPILSGIKFNLTNKDLILTTYNSDIIIINKIPSKNIKEINDIGSIVIPGKYIIDIIRKSINEDIKIEILDGLKLLIKTKNYESKLNGMNSEDFPNLDIKLNKEPIIIKTNDLLNIINQTAFAASESETKPVLTGVNLIINNNKIEAIATDLHRLAKKSITIPNNINNIINIVIPSKNLIELKSILPEINEDIKIHLFENKIIFQFNNILFQSKLINSTYPNTDQTIPKTSSIIIKLEKDELYNALDRVSLISNEHKIKLNIQNNKLIISSGNLELGNAIEKIKINKNNEEDLTITLNSKYFMESLKVFNNNEIELHFNNNNQPILIKDSKDETMIQLLLPIITI